MARNVELEDRVIRFAVGCIHICERMPPSKFGSTNLMSQLFRSATSVAANYSEAGEAESARDFVHKLKIALKELSETRTWLRIAVESQYADVATVTAQVAESKELARIFSASVITTKKRHTGT